MRGRLVFLVMGGCYAAHPPSGAACAADGECPSPLACSAGTCVDGVTTTAMPDAFACTPIATSRGVITAAAFTPTLDGDLADWTSCFIELDPSTGVVRDDGAMGMFPGGRFSVAHDATHVYVAAEVTGVLPLGDQGPPAIYANNSISFYIDGDGASATATYGSDTAQIVIDHANQQQPFQNTVAVALPNITSAARTDHAVYTIEMSVEPSTFGLARFGSAIGFDLGFEGGNGTAQTSEVYWFQSCGLPTCGCSATTAAPYCDARELGTVALP